MRSTRFLVVVALLSFASVSPLLSVPAAGSDVDKTVILSGFEFHVDSPSAPADPTITVDVGDILRLRIENQDSAFHTFTMAHTFSRASGPVDVSLPDAGAVAFVNITTAQADAGKWQFWCTPHASGSGENHQGMIGWIQVGPASPPPSTPGFDAMTAIVAAVAAVLVAGLAARRLGTRPR